MATLIFDIETIARPWSEFDDTTKQALQSWGVQADPATGEADQSFEQLQSTLGLSPLTGTVASIAVYDVERKEGAVYVVSGAEPNQTTTDSGYKIKHRSEAQLLEDFWEGARSYDVFVTFNGRQFDIPFLLHRSVACGIKPSVELVKNRYLTQQTYPYHIDLLEELTFNRAMPRRASLHMFCQAYDIPSPKAVRDGSSVASLVEDEAWQTLANYNATDVVATHALYEKWKGYLAPRSFINSLEF